MAILRGSIIEIVVEIVVMGLGLVVAVVGYVNFYDVSFPTGCLSVSCGPPHYYIEYRIAFLVGAIATAVGAMGLTRNLAFHAHRKPV